MNKIKITFTIFLEDSCSIHLNYLSKKINYIEDQYLSSMNLQFPSSGITITGMDTRFIRSEAVL
jgi:hypothetical protein